MSKIQTQLDLVIDIIKTPEELIEFAQTLLKAAVSKESQGVSLNLGLGFYGAVEQSFQLRFINSDNIGSNTEEDEQEYDEDEDDVEQELETDENSSDEDTLTSGLLDLFAGMGFVVLGANDGNLVLGFPEEDESERELTDDELDALCPDGEDGDDVNSRYTGQY